MMLYGLFYDVFSDMHIERRPVGGEIAGDKIKDPETNEDSFESVEQARLVSVLHHKTS